MATGDKLTKIYLSTSRLSTAVEEYGALKHSMESWLHRLKNCDSTLNSVNSGSYQDAFSEKNRIYISDSYSTLQTQTEGMYDNLLWTKEWANALLNRADDFVELLEGEEVLQTEVYMSAATAETECLLYDDTYCKQGSYIGDIKTNTETVTENSDEENENLKGIIEALGKVTSVNVNIDDDVQVITDSIIKQKRVENVFDSLKIYVAGVGVLNDHVRVNLGNLTTSYAPCRSNFRYTDYTQGETDDDAILARAQAMEEYVYGPNAMEHLEATMKSWIFCSPQEQEKIITVFDICARAAAATYDDAEAEPYLVAMETIMNSMITTRPVGNHSNHKYDIVIDEKRADVFMAGLDEESDAYKIMAEFVQSPTFTEPHNAYSKDSPKTKIDLSLDMAGINCAITIATTTNNGTDYKTEDVLYYTSQERSAGYIDEMQSRDPDYADHLLNDLGFTEGELAAMLTMAESRKDMVVLEALVNADDDYKNFFANSCNGVSDSCQQVIAAFVIDFFVRNDNEQDAVNELNIFTTSLMNATDGTNNRFNTSEYLELIAVGLGVQNSVDIENFIGDMSNEFFEERLEISNTLFSLYATLYGVYDEFYESDAYCNGIDKDAEINFVFQLSPFPDGSYFSNQKMSFSLDVIDKNQWMPWNEDLQARASIIASVSSEVGVYSGAEANLEIDAKKLSELSEKIKAKKTETVLSTAWSAISVFLPEGNLLTMGISEVSAIYEGVKSWKTMSKEEIEEYKENHEKMSLNLFCSYRRGTDEAVPCDPAILKEVYNWDQNGCAYIFNSCYGGEKDYRNEDVNSALYKGNTQYYSETVMDSLYVTLTYDTPDHRMDYDEQVSQIEKKSGYTMEQIDDAMNVIIFGGSNRRDNNQYESILDIPYDLINACVKAIDDSNYDSKSLCNAWNVVVNSD